MPPELPPAPPASTSESDLEVLLAAGTDTTTRTAGRYPDWPYPPGKPVQVFAIDRSRGPSHIRLVTITLVDRRVVRVEHGVEDLEAVIYGRAEISITHNPIE